MARRTTNRKQQVNVLKQAWEWANCTEPENITRENVESAYRIMATGCVQGNCRRNCKANPNCFNCLGERFWLGEIKDEYWLDCEDPENERRPENAFVGLRNLGATCYVNTLLQVWFHNPTFRSAMYKYVSPETPGNDLKQESIQDPQPTGTSDFPTLTNHSSENGETSDDTSCSAKAFKHSGSCKKGSTASFYHYTQLK
ncbi:Ubiquitin carboxyl-terminal hydrolase 48 [Porites harrisoni]